MSLRLSWGAGAVAVVLANRRCRTTGRPSCPARRLCNSCHCKSYRLKRKAADAEQRVLAASSAGGNSGGLSDGPRLRRRPDAAAAAATAAGSDGSADSASRSAVLDDHQPRKEYHRQQAHSAKQGSRDRTRQQSGWLQAMEQQPFDQTTDDASGQGGATLRVKPSNPDQARSSYLAAWL
jgi:hypothetical protein